MAEVGSGPAAEGGAAGAKAVFDVPGVCPSSAQTPASAVKAGGGGVLTRKEGRDLRMPPV